LLQESFGQNAYYLNSPIGFKERFYSAQQAELAPVCIIQPETAEQVSHAVNIIRDQECAFAVKSGGHGQHAGSSSIHNGIVIDLIKLNNIELSDDKSTALIAAGNTWKDVYPILEEHGLAVIGGRHASVGVGGFTLGGTFTCIHYKKGA
jgi:FAD/FMN-containing dehydrogenase